MFTKAFRPPSPASYNDRQVILNTMDLEPLEPLDLKMLELKSS